MKHQGKVIGFFGGSFNPPHLGHVLAAIYAKQLYELDEIWFAPVYEHAFAKPLSPFTHRINMCRLAIKGLGKGYKVSDIEKKINAQGKSLLTLRALKKLHPNVHFKLLLGTDTWSQRKKWYQFATIEKEFGYLKIPRAGIGTPKTFAIPNISSTYIRSHLNSPTIKEWMNPQVLAYYKKHLAKPT